MKMIRKSSTTLFFLAVISLLLSGCMYPTDDKAALETPYEDQIDTVQKAVNAYKENTGGLLPIKTREEATDLYIKYPIEFSKLVPEYTEKIPSNAYENG